MLYRVLLLPSALKQLEALPKAAYQRVLAKIRALDEEPRPSGVKKLQGSAGDLWRIRIGDYRVIYRVKDAELIVLIIEVGHRREVYR